MAKRKSKSNSDQLSFLESYGKTAAAVPAIRQAVKEWRENGYKGVTYTSQTLLNYWFYTDHKQVDGSLFRYHDAQREAIEALIYVFEIAQTRSLLDLYQRFIPAELASQVYLPSDDPFARYCVKMATGSGKTKVMSLAIAWQYFNAVIEADDSYAKTFLVIAPNVIVFERLRTDFVGAKIFREDPIIPKEMKVYWDMQVYVRGEAERSSSEGAIYLTNIQQLYETSSDKDDEPDIMTAVLGAKPPANLEQEDNFRERLLQRDTSRVMVINDEAHHTHDPESAWNEAIRNLHSGHAYGLSAQLDFSATPRYSNSGRLFEWTVSDYPLRQAIIDGIVKRPLKGITDLGEISSSVPSVRYEPFIVAGIERWREYQEQLTRLNKKPLLFIMMNDTHEADSIGEYLRVKYPSEFGGNKTLIIHTKRNGDIVKEDLDLAREAARNVDRDDSPVNAIVSVLMLREGWDVNNVTVIVGLRPYTAKANILPEQTIGRGLRKMFRNSRNTYTERVDIIGNPGFINFVQQLEQTEEFELGTFKVGKDKLTIVTVAPDPEKAHYDIAVPILSPILTRVTALADEIEAINVMRIKCPPLPITADKQAETVFRYEGMDILTLEKLFERTYVMPTLQTSQEIISYFAQVIAQELKLPSQFAVLAPKIRDFLKHRAFNKEVDLDSREILDALSRKLTRVVTMKVFLDLLREKLVRPQTPELLSEGRRLSEILPFPWSQETIVTNGAS